jgi:NAD-dependent DNA ligase
MSFNIDTDLIKNIEKDPHKQGIELPLKTLETIISMANEAYYNTDKPLLRDNTYDILYLYLEKRDSTNQLLKKVGAPINREDKVKLPYYLGSLDKVKPNEKSLTKWLNKHNKNILISDKLDGLSCLLTIDIDKYGFGISYSRDGIIMNLYKHGDGYEGQNISHLLNHINIGKLKKKIIKDILEDKKNSKQQIALRGEIIIRNDIYNKKYSKQYPKARSLIAGIVNSKTPDENIVKDMEVVFYEYIYPENMTFGQQFDIIAKMGFNIANHKMFDNLVESQLPEILLEYKQESPYEIDGIVLDDSSQVWSRAKKNNPDYAVAFKMQLEEQIATTTVINVEYNISKHGTLAPRIEYDPVVIKGDTHKYTTGFNMKYIVDNKINRGTQIQIIKSGDVIPYIYKIIKSSNQPQMPPANMKWHWNESQVDAILDNPEANEDVRLQKIIAFFKTMKIDGIGEGVVAKLIQGGYEDLQTILNLTPDMISQIEGFQLKSATNIYNNIHKILDKPQPLERIMTASGVFQIGLGEKKFKIILDAIPNFLKKYQQGSIYLEDITGIQGFSNKTADILLEGMPKFITWLTLHNIIKIDSDDISKKDIPKGNKFAGMVVVFTGIRNTEIETAITVEGGTIGTSITGKTTLLVAKDPNENSSKIQKAHAQGIEISSYTDFVKKYNFKI